MLKLKNITKLFPGVRALNNINLEFKEGEIHALVGENGAGKSTMINIICGNYQADEGTVELNGKKLQLQGYHDAVENHISVVNQEINLIPNSSIAENICLDKLKSFTKFGFVDWNKVNAVAKKYMDQVKLNLNPEMSVRNISSAQKQMIQIARALSSEAKVLLLDEPTSSLTQYESDILFEILNRLKSTGVIIIFVTHKLEEVLEISDKVSVLRDGKLIGTDNKSNMTRDRIIQMMIGRESSYVYRGRLDADNNETIFEIKNLSSKIFNFKNLNLSLKQGEILGLYGLVGSGRTEFIKTALGIYPRSSGEVLLNGNVIDTSSFSNSLHKYKIGYVTENRKEEGLFLNNSVGMNICINSLEKYYYNNLVHFLDSKKEVDNSTKYINKLEIKTPSDETKTSALSGGNQQKISIAKWLSADCNLLIIDEPTIGVDIGAKEYIHQLIWDLAKKQNKTVILISSDMNEIVSLARRIIIFKEKAIVNEIKGEEIFALPGEEISSKIGEYFI